MKVSRTIFVLSAVVAVMSALSIFGQKMTFADPNVDYGFDLPDANWKMTVKPSATSPNVEYVYGDRNHGHLEVRKLTVGKDTMWADIIAREEDKLRFREGYIAGREEIFRGTLTGKAFNFEFVRGGRPSSGRFYFLRADDTTIYVLRFIGFTDQLKTLRNQTDFIARTFALKKA